MLENQLGVQIQMHPDDVKMEHAIIPEKVIQLEPVLHAQRIQENTDELPTNITDWPEYWLEAYVERAAIMEFDGRLSRLEAESKAEMIQRENYKFITGGVTNPV